jgi:hypothetical protein
LIILAQRIAGGGKYAAPYDSTQGVPGIVFVFCWILILAFLARLAREYRDVIFKSKEAIQEKSPKRKQPK